MARRLEDGFAQCAPGLERLLGDELRELGVRLGRRERGGVEFRATTRQLYAANLWLRTASRVLLRVGRELPAGSFAALERTARSLDWSEWLAPGTAPEFRVTTHRSVLTHTDAVAGRLTETVADQLGTPTGDDAPRQLFVVRLFKDRLTLSLDASGEPLHRRGWRRQGGKAPLRETLAAAMVLGSGWDRRSPLVDPFCGAGTIPIEAALLATDRAPGRDRDFAFARWPAFAPGTWASVTGEAAEREAAAPDPPPILGTDRDDGVVAAARANAGRAGVGEQIGLERRTITELEAAAPVGWVVTDPPHGHRLGGGDLRDLYARFGQAVGRLGEGWTVALLGGDRVLTGHTGLELEVVLETRTGGRPVELLLRTGSEGSPGGS